jgi:hypothetical protein
MFESGVDAAERATGGEQVGDNWTEMAEQSWIAENGDVVTNGFQRGKRTVKKGLATEFQESLIGAHARAFTASKQKCGTRQWRVIGHAEMS